MTVVSINELSDGFVFECKGHSGYAEKGFDIVCAGISALCSALAARLSELADEYIICIEYFHCADGEMYIEVRYGSDPVCRIKALDALDTVRCGLELIEAEYPDNLFIE